MLVLNYWTCRLESREIHLPSQCHKNMYPVFTTAQCPKKLKKFKTLPTQPTTSKLVQVLWLGASDGGRWWTRCECAILMRRVLGRDSSLPCTARNMSYWTLAWLGWLANEFWTKSETTLGELCRPSWRSIFALAGHWTATMHVRLFKGIIWHVITITNIQNSNAHLTGTVLPAGKDRGGEPK